jgi:hypothetical protein
MPKNIKIEFPVAKQGRSAQSLEDILQAAFKLVDAADPKTFTGRTLAEKSGYSLGTMTKRLGVIENAFLWVIKQGQTQHLGNMANKFREFDAHLPLQSFFEIMVDNSFKSIKQVNPRVMRYYEDCFAKQNALSSEFYHYVDALAEPYVEAALKNQTNTFRHISIDEAILLFRSAQTIVERPFVELNPIAGTEEHRRIAISALVQMFGNKVKLSQ